MLNVIKHFIIVSGTWQKAKVFLSLPVNIEMAKRTNLFKSAAQDLFLAIFSLPLPQCLGLNCLCFINVVNDSKIA